MYGSRSLFVVLATLLTACGGDGGNDNRPSSNANLTSLLVEAAILDPAFASSITRYDASVNGGTTETRVTAITTDSRARLTINGDSVASGSPSDPIALPIGDTDVNVVVTAEDGTTKTYSVEITRPVPGTDASLAALALSAGPLLQPFDSARLDYDAAFGYLATTTRVLATPNDPLADSLSVDGELAEFGEPSDLVSLAVGIGATTLAVTVTAEDDASTQTYEVDISRAEFNTLDQAAYLKATNTDPGDRFAASLALSGDTLLLGAPSEQSLARGIDGDQSDNAGNSVGAVYLYERIADVWTPAHYLKAANADNGDQFGFSTASTDELLAVGAPNEQSRSNDPADNSGNAVGAVYLFDPDLAGAPDQVAYLKASNADDLDRFGSAIAISGNRLLIGAPFEASNASGVNGDESNNSLNNAGAAYLFEPDDAGDFVQTAYLKASNPTSGTDNQFGNAIAVSGDTLAVAAWRENGGAAGIDGDQTDTSAPNAGAVYVFEQNDDGTWQQAAYVKASNPGADHNFGTSITLDGDTLAVGAPGENTSQPGAGAVYVFSRDATGLWGQDALLRANVIGLNDGFGSRVELIGNLLAVAAPGERSDATGINDNDDNESAVDSGATYLFERDAAGDWQQIAYVKASNTDPGDSFGSALALDGDSFVIGAPAEQSSATDVDGDEASNAATDAGAAYVID
jgi:hypothetical protein